MADKVYQAIVDLTFEGLKPPARVLSGGPIPKKVPAAEIEQLLADGHIREVVAAQPESEGEDE